MKIYFQLPIVLLTVFSSFHAFAEETTTDPVGALMVTCLEGSDTILSVPFRNAATYVGPIASVAIAGNNVTVGFSANPNWTTNQFSNLYYVRFTSGSNMGRYYTVVSNTNNSLTIDSNGDTMTGIASGNTIQLIKYYTLNDLFPPATQTTFVLSLGNSGLQRRSELLIPNLTSIGTNLAPSRVFFVTSSGWFEASAGNANANNVVLLPDTYFIVRNKSGYGSTSFIATGSVEMNPIVIPISISSGAKQDNYLSLIRPVNVKLSQLNLTSDVFTPSLGLSGLLRRDELLIYSNTQVGTNKAPSRAFFKTDSGWFESTAGNAPADNVEITAATGFVIRKYQGTSNSTVFWVNLPNY